MRDGDWRRLRHPPPSRWTPPRRRRMMSGRRRRRWPLWTAGDAACRRSETTSCNRRHGRSAACTRIATLSPAQPRPARGSVRGDPGDRDRREGHGLSVLTPCNPQHLTIAGTWNVALTGMPHHARPSDRAARRLLSRAAGVGTAATRRCTEVSCARPSLMKIELTCFSTADRESPARHGRRPHHDLTPRESEVVNARSTHR